MQEITDEKLVISDTSCLIAFTNSNKLNVLNKTFNNIEVPPDVKREYEIEYDNILPGWIKVKEPKDIEWVKKLKNKFGDGESEAIVLANEENNSLIVLDDLNARNYAIDIGLNVTGTLGILNKAKEKDIITLDEAINIINIMKRNKFRASDELLENVIEIMKKDEERKQEKRSCRVPEGKR